MRNPVVVLLVLLLLLFAFAPRSHACDYAAVFVRSYHFDRDGKYNEENYGLGCERSISENWKVSGGFYKNSIYRTSWYAGGAWTPLKLGNWKAGAFVGVVTGYEKDLIVPIPLVAYEHPDGWGLNFLVVPPATKGNQSTAGGVIGVQVKFRLGS